MYPQLFSAASRFAPVLSRLASRGAAFASPFWKASQIDVPGVTPSGVGAHAAPTGPSPPISGISPGYQDTPSIKGLINSGNIDIHKRPIVRNPDGTISTVRSLSANFGNGEVLMPTVSDDGRIMSDKEAMDTYRKTGRHLGIFDTPDNATAYAKSLHEDQAKEYGAKAPQMPWWASGDMSKMFPGASPAPAPAPVSAPQTAPVPMPQARPADAPQAQPDTSFFMRNAMMQHDPITGQLLDPSGASSVSGPDLISKMMTYLHGKA
jgi:hypothetical protein